MFLDTRQAALLLNISPRTLEGWRLTGEGPTYTKAGRRVLYYERGVLDWLASRCRQSTSDAVEVVQ